MDELADALETLAKRLEALEHRVGALEKRPDARPAFSASPWTTAPPPNAQAASPPSENSGLLSLVGKALLAIAGAYLLRAAVTSHAIPQIPIVALAIAYAFAWLIPAARSKAQNWIPSVIWAGTSVLIFLPMIWELTLRFRILPAAVAASILGLYAVVAAIAGWNRNFREITWVAEGFASIAALALAIATHQMVPFITVLLVISAVGEIAALRRPNLQARYLLAAAADVTVFALIWIYSGPAASRPDYPAVSSVVLLIVAPLLLFLYAASTNAQTIRLRRNIPFFETAQTLTAFALTFWSFLAFWSSTGRIILGVFCLGASAIGYAISFALFDRIHANRNYHVYATGSLILLLAGCFLSLPGLWLIIFLAVFALGAGFAAPRIRHPWFEFHALSALIAMAAASGSLLWSAGALAGAPPATPGGRISLVAASAILCFIASLRYSADFRWNRPLVLITAAVGVFASAGLLVWGATRIGIQLGVVPTTPGPQHVAVIRTLVICGFALGLAWSGSKWRRQELVWLAWTALALGALKLVFEDLRHGHLAFTATSIFVYAITLLFASRLMRPRTKTQNS